MTNPSSKKSATSQSEPTSSTCSSESGSRLTMQSQVTETKSSLDVSAATSQPFPLLSYQVAPSPPLSFSAIIEQDHTEINAAAGLLLRKAASPSTTPTALRSLLDLVVWRLVRHDVSEDIVMRPAFISVLGSEGEEMAAHDRKDHEAAKLVLLKLYDSGLLDENDAEDPARQAKLKFFIVTVSDLFRELAEHMRIESGEQIPRLESFLSRERSEELARRYLRTQEVLIPELKVGGTKVWADVKQYANTDLQNFHRVFANVVEKDAKGSSKL